MATICVSAKGAALAFMLALLTPSIAVSESRAESLSGSEKSTKADSPRARSIGAYYIDFRVAQIGAYGHSYVAYGRLNAQGQPAEFRYADLHPTGNYALMALGHLVPVPATTTWDPDVLKLPVAASYRHKLNAVEYNRLLVAIQHARANLNPHWNAIMNNCNSFVAELAKAIGLRAPTDFQVSYTFIPALRDLNDRIKTEKRTSVEQSVIRPPAQ
jgi:hypothetical protein